MLVLVVYKYKHMRKYIRLQIIHFIQITHLKRLILYMSDILIILSVQIMHDQYIRHTNYKIK